MARLVYRTAALRDLAAIAEYITNESGSRKAAEAFIARITGHCERLAGLPTEMGRSRAELRPGFRSVTFGSYVIFFRYSDEDGPRSHMHIANVVHGRRDLDAFFSELTDEADC